MAEKSSGWIADISVHISSIFRHMLPGVLMVGTFFLAYPSKQKCFDFDSWHSLTLLAVLCVVSGNIWFAINRYVIHQFFDYLMWRCSAEAPAMPAEEDVDYLDGLAVFTVRSLSKSRSVDERIREHIRFRGSNILLLLTAGELLLVAAMFNERSSFVSKHPVAFVFFGLALMVGAIWQDIITRRIDYYFVYGLSNASKHRESSMRKARLVTYFAVVFIVSYCLLKKIVLEGEP